MIRAARRDFSLWVSTRILSCRMIKRAQEPWRTTSARRPAMGATLVTSLGYVTQPSRPRGRHRKQPPPRRFLLRRRLALGGSAVLLAALVVSVGAFVKWATHQPVSLPNARPATPVVPSPATPVAPSPPQPAGEPLRPTVAAPAGPFAVDDRGFVDSDARCDGTQTAVAIGPDTWLTRGDLRRPQRSVRLSGCSAQ
jgi:hypothetical protein